MYEMAVKCPFEYGVMLEGSKVSYEAEFPLCRSLLFITHSLSMYYMPGTTLSTKSISMKRVPSHPYGRRVIMFDLKIH